MSTVPVFDMKLVIIGLLKESTDNITKKNMAHSPSSDEVIRAMRSKVKPCITDIRSMGGANIDS